MKLPKFVAVGGKKVKIVIDNQLDDYGGYHHDQAEIRISRKALESEKDTMETLRHELVHAALAISGVSFNERMEEEAIVRCMDSIFFPAWDRLRNQMTA